MQHSDELQRVGGVWWWDGSGQLAATTTARQSTSTLPSPAILRRAWFAFDGSIADAASVNIRLAFTNAAAPAAADLRGTQTILPSLSREGDTTIWTPFPSSAAQWVDLDVVIPSEYTRIALETVNNLAVAVNLQHKLEIIQISRGGLNRG